MTAPLAGRLAVVTGASRGIGAAIAETLHAAGATVVRIARSLAPARAERRIDLQADLTDDGQRTRALDAVLALGTPALVVNNAGAFELAPLAEQSLEGLDRLYQANLRAPFAVAQALLPALRRAGSGRHILIGSVADHRAYPGNSAYTATKFGARGLHQVLRAELQGTGVLCTLISPGPVDTALWDAVAPDRREGLPSRHQMLRPEQVAGAVLWVASQDPGVDVELIRLGPALEREQGEQRG